MIETEVGDALLRITGIRFEIREPDPCDSDHFELARWFMVCREITEARKIPQVNVAWADRDNVIWLESVEIGDSLEWIYQHYGDVGVARVKEINLMGFQSLRTREELGYHFPKVMRRLQTYDKFLKNASEKHGMVPLEMRYQSGKERISFRLAAKIVTSSAGQSLFSEIRRGVGALSEAYDNICRYEAKIL